MGYAQKTEGGGGLLGVIGTQRLASLQPQALL